MSYSDPEVQREYMRKYMKKYYNKNKDSINEVRRVKKRNASWHTEDILMNLTYLKFLPFFNCDVV